MKTYAAASILTLALGTGAAFASFNVGDNLGTTEDEIRATLTAEGAVIEEVEIEGNEIEVEYMLDGTEVELTIDTGSGLVTEMEAELADTDEDDD